MPTKKLSRTERDKREITRLAKIHKQAREKFGTPKCPTGHIIREGYKRGTYKRKTGSKIKGTWVSPTCIKSKTGKKKGVPLFRLQKDVLGQYGYENVQEKTELQRHRALSKALEDIPALELFRRLNALSVLNKDQNPNLSKLFKSDANYIKTTKEYLNRPTARKSSGSTRK